MYFWASLPGYLLPPAIFILPVIIYRFLIAKKTLPNKMAAIVSIVYTIVGIGIILALSGGYALDQSVFFAILGFFSFYILAGLKENKIGQIILFRILWAFPCLIVQSIVNAFTAPVLIDPTASSSDQTTATIIYFASFIIVIIFYISRFKKVKENVEAKFRWREKLKEEERQRNIQNENV